jgi:hypothetical protein
VKAILLCSFINATTSIVEAIKGGSSALRDLVSLKVKNTKTLMSDILDSNYDFLNIKCKKYDEMSEESIAIIDECNDKSIQEVMAAILIQGFNKNLF